MDIDVVMSGNLSAAQLGILAPALSRNGSTVSKEEIRSAVTGGEVKFQAFDDRTGFLRVDLYLEKSVGRVADRIRGRRVGVRTVGDGGATKLRQGCVHGAQ